MNDLPRIDAANDAVWQRLLVIPFTRSIPEHEQDRFLKDKLRAEMPGILAWAVEGARRLHEARGEFSPCQAGLDLIGSYRSETNELSLFIAERMVKAQADGAKSTYSTPLSHILPRFKAWRGGRAVTPQKLARMLRKQGYVVDTARFGSQTAKALIGWTFAETEMPEKIAVEDPR